MEKKSVEKGSTIVLRDLRKRRIATQWIEEYDREVEKGLTLEMIATPRLARGGVRKVLQTTVSAFFGPVDDRPEVFGYKDIGDIETAARTRVWTTWYEVEDTKALNGKRRKFVEQDITPLNVTVVVLRRRDIHDNREDWDKGTLVEPMVCIGFGDGSAVYVEPVVPGDIDVMDMDTGYDETETTEETQEEESRSARKKRLAAEKRAEKRAAKARAAAEREEDDEDDED